MSTNINMKAWENLTDDERMSLNLQYLHDKSTWEAGEVMNKAHYKYLEIKYRAEHFLRLFTTHFDIYDELLPNTINITPAVRMYLEITIGLRKVPKEAMAEIKLKLGKKRKEVESELSTWIVNNGESELLTTNNVIALIKEYDRANNHRILPKELQEPSFYKRRNKNIHKKQIKLITQLNPLSLQILIRNYSCKTPTGFYTGIVNNGEKLLFNVRKQYINKLGAYGFYVWANKELAMEYIDLVDVYINTPKKNCKEGLNFWPKYRELIPKAFNYHQVQKITMTRKLIEVAAHNLEFI